MEFEISQQGLCEITFVKSLDEGRFRKLKGYLTNNYILLEAETRNHSTIFKLQLNKKYMSYIEKRKSVMTNLCRTESSAVDFMVNLNTELAEMVRKDLSLILKHMSITNGDFYIRVY